MLRQQVYLLVDREREYQKHWDKDRIAYGNTKNMDANKPIEAWLVYMEHYINRAKAMVAEGDDENKALGEVLKVAALAVACMENLYDS